MKTIREDLREKVRITPQQTLPSGEVSWLFLLANLDQKDCGPTRAVFETDTGHLVIPREETDGIVLDNASTSSCGEVQA